MSLLSGRRVAALPLHTVATLLVAAALAAMGCGGGGGGGSGPLTLDMYGTQYMPAICKRQVACDEMPDQATCEATLRLPTSYLETMKAGVASGKVVFDPSAAGMCVGFFNMMTSCKASEIGALAQQAQVACAGVFKGTVAGGGACFFGEECASGSCANTGCSGACCAGACVPAVAPVPVGGDCSALLPNQQCVLGTYCHVDLPTGSATCVVFPNAVGAACDGGFGCGAGLNCDADPTTDVGTCKRGAATGAACDPATGRCDDGRDRCDATTAVCVPRSPVGTACDPNDSLGCVLYAVCSSATSTCQALGRPGAACSFAAGRVCLNDLTCDTATATCVTVFPPGPACM